MSRALAIPGFSGRLLGPTDADYELARLTSNAACDARRALIVRLRQLKHRWDPDNFFEHSHNISPTDGS